MTVSSSSTTKATSKKPMTQSDKFDELTGQRVGHKKHVAFSALTAETNELLSRGVKLKSINAENSLGIQMEVHGKIDSSVHDKT